MLFHHKFLFASWKEEVLAPPPENDDVVNDFDIEEEVIEVENRFDILANDHLFRLKLIFIKYVQANVFVSEKTMFLLQERRIWQK